MATLKKTRRVTGDLFVLILEMLSRPHGPSNSCRPEKYVVAESESTNSIGAPVWAPLVTRQLMTSYLHIWNRAAVHIKAQSAGTTRSANQVTTSAYGFVDANLYRHFYKVLRSAHTGMLEPSLHSSMYT